MTELARWRYRVEAGRIADFARALGAEPGGAAPPTFTMAASAEVVERLVTGVLGLDRARTVHGEQAFEYHAPVRAGMELEGVVRLLGEARRTGRRGGEMRVLTLGIDYRDAATGAPLLAETMVILEREAP